MNEIFDFIATDSFHFARITANKIYNKVQILHSFPMIGKVVQEFNNTHIRELIVGRYRIIYRIKTKQQVDILRIYHSSRLLKRKDLK